ncbi:MAG: hypothetical protein JNK82_13315 [Myxococcaceae bacterium]|nr:hypothetical protein [Myxococcaceae bacterium]
MTQACSRCGTFFKSERDVMFNDAGDVVCERCFDVGEIDAAGARTASWVKSTAYFSPLFAMGALIIWRLFSIPGLLLVVASVMSSAGVLATMFKNDGLRTRLGAHVLPASVFLLAAIGICVVGGLLLMLGGF